MRNVMNLENLSDNYQLFLGQDLGFNDEINVTFPKLQEIKEKQQSMFWLASEFHFNQDRIDLLAAPDHEKDVMLLNLLSQFLMDSVASRSIIDIFGDLLTNPELHSWLLWQSAFEDIHASTYSKIIRNCYSDSVAVLERGKRDLEVFDRSAEIGKVFNQLIEAKQRYVNDEINKYELKEYIMKAMVVLYCLEAISFQASFSATFALVNTGRYQTIGTAVHSILKDELLHAEGDLIVVKAMTESDTAFKEIFEENKNEYRRVIRSIIDQEYRWSDYLFEDGRKVLGLTPALLKQYVTWLAGKMMDNLELEWYDDIERVNENPLSYMNAYLFGDQIQVANQEITNNNYRVGQSVNDLDDIDFDF